jgi:hypothetical protein
MKRITEKRDVQDQLINYLTGIGWQFIPQGDFKTDQWRGIDEAGSTPMYWTQSLSPRKVKA